MTHVTGSELSRFIARGECSAAFEQHVDECPFCASALTAHAKEAVAAPQSRHSWAPWLALAACVTFLALIPKVTMATPSISSSSNVSLIDSAGVPDAGALTDQPVSPLFLATLDAGGRPPSQ